MLTIVLTLHMIGLNLANQARTKLNRTPDRGSETIEKILWAVAVVAIVAIAVAAIRGFVATQAGNL